MMGLQGSDGEMDDREVMARLGDLEREIGAPGFWDRLPEAVSDVCKEHSGVLGLALDRGLVEKE